MGDKVVQTILVMAVITYALRFLPMLLLRGRKIEGFAQEFIQLVPVALLAALVIPELVMPGGEAQALRHNPYLWAALLTFIFAKYVPNLFLAVFFGMIVYWGLDRLLL